MSGLRPSNLIDTPRADNTQTIVGSEGRPIGQSSDGTIQTIRGTVSRTDASLAFDQDLIADGDVVFGPRDFSGTDSVSGAVESDDSNNLRVDVEYLDANDNVVGPGVQFGPDTVVEFVDIPHRFDRLRVTITDTSGAAQNNVTGSLYVV